MSTTALIAIGGYSRSGSGRGPGITLVGIDPSDPSAGAETRAVVELPDPSFVLWSPDGTLLYAVLETSPTRVVAVRVGEDARSADVVADLTLDGSGGCHLAFGRLPRTLLVADYGSGTVETVSLDEAGLPVDVLDVEDHHDRGDGYTPHPHQVVAMPGNDLLAVPDLGLDRVFLYRQDRGGQLGLAGEIPLSRGSGPRHLTADHESSQLFISCELSGKVAVATRRQEPPQTSAPPALRRSSHRWSVDAMVPASGGEDAAAVAGGPGNAVSHLELTADEGTVLVANRGPDTLAVLSLVGMRPQLLAEIAVGAHPRHFTRLGDLVLVAAQDADRVDVLRLQRGQLEVAAEPIAAPSAACIAVRP